MKQKTVLLVEDEPALSQALSHKLRDAGFTVEIAEDGETALDRIRQLKPALIFLDILMPTMSGLEVLERLKHDPAFDRSKTVICVLTNFAGKQDEPIIREMAKACYIKSELPLNDIVEKAKDFLKA